MTEVTYDATIQEHGFNHICHCESDQAEGKMTLVTECLIEMAAKAVPACGALMAQLQQKEAENVQLRVQVNELGGTLRG